MGMGKHIKYDDEWILAHKDEFRLIKDLWVAYCENVEQIRLDAFKAHTSKKLGIKANCWWSKEEDNFLREWYPKIGTAEMVVLVNDMFGKHRTLASVVNRAEVLGIKVNQDIADQNHYMLKRREVGAESTDGMGYERVKSADGRWVRKGKYIYEQHYGKVPKGYNVIFLDGNTRNYDINNLMAIPNNYSLLLAVNRLRSDHPEITKTGIKWCDLYTKEKEYGIQK